jgi:lactoylglutathione lyase
MPHFIRLTPNLLVGNIDRSLAFYADLLGFDRGMTVPDQPPFVFASVTSGTVEIFFNDAAAAVKEYPRFAGQPIGATGTMYIEVDAVDALHDRIKDRVNVTMPLVTQFYGVREFAIEDPDGYVITFAQRIQQ